MLRLGILHDFAQDECPGGANETLKVLYETAPNGVEVYWLPTGNPLQWRYLDNFIVASTRSISNSQLEYLLKDKKYVKVFLDYRRVPPKVIQDAKLLVYMSPKQKRDMLGSGPAHVMPSLVDPDLFYPADKPGNGYLWVGNFSRQKGIRTLWEWADNNRVHIDFYGYGTPRVYLEQSEYCHIKVPISYDEIPELYRKYRMFIHLPKNFEAGSRVFIEAALSGLEIITNDFEGDLSFDNPYSEKAWRDRLKKAPHEFWQKTLQVLG